jgi:hypothetical protein
MPSSGVWRRVDVVDWTDVSAATCSRWFFAREFFYPEDGGDTILRNVGSIDYIYTAPHPRRRHSSVCCVVLWHLKNQDYAALLARPTLLSNCVYYLWRLLDYARTLIGVIISFRFCSLYSQRRRSYGRHDDYGHLWKRSIKSVRFPAPLSNSGTYSFRITHAGLLELSHKFRRLCFEIKMASIWVLVTQFRHTATHCKTQCGAIDCSNTAPLLLFK